MATTQAQFIENTIRDMKKAMSRNDDASDSDSSITRHTNRGNKLKRKAKHVREGRLAQADGPQVYKKRILYNDYQRYILSRNPPRVDQDGDVVDSDNENSDLETTDAEDDPYREVRLENILMPLTAAGDLDKHPSLSVPFTNQVLEQMVQNVQDMVQREQTALWRLRSLQTQFCGDQPFAQAGSFEGGETMQDFEEPQEIASAVQPVINPTHRVAQTSANWDTMANVRLMADLENAADSDKAGQTPQTGQNKTQEQQEGEQSAEDTSHDRCVGSLDGEAHNSTRQDVSNHGSGTGDGASGKANSRETQGEDHDNPGKTAKDVPISAEHSKADGQLTRTADITIEKTNEQASDRIDGSSKTDSHQQEVEPKQELSNTTSRDDPPPTNPTEDTQATLNGDAVSIQDYAMSDTAALDGTSTTSDGPRRMATRAHTRANAPDTNGQSTPPLSSLPSPHLSTAQSTAQIHPFFLPPPQSLPTPNAGLTHPGLADEARRQISLYVQKQQEVARQANELLTGLRRALRLKDTVWDWCHSEKHVGEMSDGEDWIDCEKWGISPEELRKGEEVEDEDPAGMVVKKTRNRRGAQ